MSTDADDLHRQFLVQAAMSAIEAIDDAVAAETRDRLSQSTKDNIGRILEAGFSRVLEGSAIGDWDRVTAETIWGLVDSEVHDADEAGLEAEIRSEVLRAFANFAEGLVGMADDELHRRRK